MLLLFLSYAVLLIEKKDQEGQAQVLSAALQVRINMVILTIVALYPVHISPIS